MGQSDAGSALGTVGFAVDTARASCRMKARWVGQGFRELVLPPRNTGSGAHRPTAVRERRLPPSRRLRRQVVAAVEPPAIRAIAAAATTIPTRCERDTCSRRRMTARITVVTG